MAHYQMRFAISLRLKMNKIYKQVERFKNEIKMLNNKINVTNTLLQIKSLCNRHTIIFKHIYIIATYMLNNYAN